MDDNNYQVDFQEPGEEQRVLSKKVHTCMTKSDQSECKMKADMFKCHDLN